jgi:hypothetical protein
MRRAKTLTLVSDKTPKPAPDPADISDLSDLPPELLSELSIAQVDVLERQVLTVLQELGGAADLDRILIALYRRFQVVQKRRFLQNKLWRMVRKGQVLKPEGARGVFRLEPRKPRRRRK